MKIRRKKVSQSLFISTLGIILLTGLLVCNNRSNTSEKSMAETKIKKDSLTQNPADLLLGTAKAVCYSGFRTGQHPDRGEGAVNPSYAEILEDLKLISNMGFSLIRIYDSGENSELILQVIQENNLNIKVLLGIWLQAELSNHLTCAWLTEPIPDDQLAANRKLNLREINRGIQLAKTFDTIVVAVNVGNEALVDWNDHKVDTDTIISYVKRVKKAINQPVTVADNYKWWADHGQKLARVVDFMSLHVYPIWEEKDINEGLSYSIENLMEVRRAIPNTPMVITEAGWASVASEFGPRAGEEKQLQYYNELMEWSAMHNITTFWFEAFDEDWKGDPHDMMGAEKHWGLYTVDRVPKKVADQLLIETEKRKKLNSIN